MPASSSAEPQSRTTERVAIPGAGNLPVAALGSASFLVLLAALVAMPAYFVKLSLTPSITPNVLELVLLPGILLAVLAIAGGLRPRPWSLMWPALALLALGLPAILWSPNRHYAIGIYRTYLLEPIAAAYVLHVLLDRPLRVWLTAAALVASGLIAAIGQLYSAVQQLQHGIPFDVHPPAGIYENANMGALFLVPALCIAAGLAFRGALMPRPVGAAAAAVLLAGLIATYSKGGFVAAAAAGIIFWLFAVRRWRWPIAGAALASAALLALLAPGLLLRIGHTLNPADTGNTLVTRTEIWTAAVAMLRNHPITGVGLADFEALLHTYAPTLHETHTHPHNLFLNVWLNLGILGLIAFIAVLAVLIAAIVCELRRGRRTEFYFLICAAAAALAGILTHGMVDNPIWKNDLALQFWALAALVTAARQWQQAQDAGKGLT